MPHLFFLLLFLLLFCLNLSIFILVEGKGHTLHPSRFDQIILSIRAMFPFKTSAPFDSCPPPTFLPLLPFGGTVHEYQ